MKEKPEKDRVRNSQNQLSAGSLSTDASEEDTPLLANSGRHAKAYVIAATDDVPVPSEKERQYIATLAATLGVFALGNVLAWTSPNGTKLVRSDTNLEPTQLTEEEWTWIGSLVNIGAGISVLVAGYLINKVGCKTIMLGLAVPFAVGWLFIAWAEQVVCLYYIGRFITGMAGGAFTLTVPIYISEIAESDIRGALGTYFQLMFTCGVLFVYVLGGIPAVSVFALNMTCAAVPILFGLIFIFMPESPVYYVKKGYNNKAHKSLKWLRGKMYDTEPELQEILDAVEAIETQKSSFRDSFNTTAAKKSLGISLGLMFFQQLSGVNVIIFYISFIFKSAGSSVEPSVATIIVGIILVLSTAVSSLLVDRLGRKVLLYVSGSVMATCMLVLGVFFHFREQAADVGWLPIAAACIFIAVFNLGYGPVPWLMAAELFPLEIKNAAVSITCFANWFLSFLVTKFFSNLLLACGWAVTLWIFSSVSALGTVFVMLFVPETKGRTLEDIQRELRNDVPPANAEMKRDDKRNPPKSFFNIEVPDA